MRGLAAVSVMVLRVANISGASGHRLVGPLLAHTDIGVTLFFLISGFLLYRPFVANRVLGHQMRVRVSRAAGSCRSSPAVGPPLPCCLLIRASPESPLGRSLFGFEGNTALAVQGLTCPNG